MDINSIVYDDTMVMIRKYKLRKAGKGTTIEVTIPREVFEREMRRLGIAPNKAHDEVDAIWRFNSFHGLYLSFEPKGGN